MKPAWIRYPPPSSPTQPQPTVKPAWTRHPPPSSPTKTQTQWSKHENVISTSLPSFITSAYSKASMNPPSSSLFSYTTSAYSGASKNPLSSPPPPSLLNLILQWIQEKPSVLPLPTQPQPTVKPSRTRRPPPPYSTSAYSESIKNPPSSPSLLNLSLQWSQQEAAVLPLPT